MRHLLLAAVALPSLLAAALPAAAPAPVFDPARVSADVNTLASDAYEGRGPATAGEAKSVAYIVAQMKAAGLQPGGDLAGGKRGWTQDVPLLRSEIVGDPAVTAGGATLVQGKDIAIRAPLNGQDRVAIADAPIVFVGYGVSAPERKWDDFKGVDLHGKIALVLINDPDFEGGEGKFDGKAMTYYGRWTYKYEELARRGAAGVLIVHETAPASYGWATVANSNANTQFDIVRKDPAAAHTAMEAWVQAPVADALLKASGSSLAAAKAAARTAAFRPMPLKATFTARYAAKTAVIHSKNVLGRLPGAGHPDETVIYSAHWDHLGVGRPDAKGDLIYNGAADNASGIAALLELARVYAHAPRPDRSVVFLAVTAEEKGLLGSEYYAANPVYPLATTAGVLNMDVPFGYGAARDFSISGAAKLGLLDMLTAEAGKQGRHYSPDADPAAGHFFRSDHFSFAKRGVPALSYEQGRDLVAGGKAAGDAADADYVKNRYHQPGDEWRPGLTEGQTQQVLSVLYATGRDLADGRQWPNWSADSEFRAARDATAAQRR
jgi:Zn-dependent M28 family amino/carboxypeptidase